MTYIIANLQYINKQFEKEKAKGIQQDASAVKISEAVNECLQGAEKIKDIALNLKGFARADHQPLAAVDIHEVLNSVIKMASPEAKNRAALKSDFNSELPRLLLNSTKLHQVFLNLIINAIQALEKNNFNVNIIQIKTYKEKNYIGIDIADNGKGISPETQSHIFDPFFTTKEIGTGLGLSICYDIIHELGGNITVKSKVGVGTVFTIHLPLSLIAESEISSVIEPIVVGKNIMIIDDEPSILTVLDRILGADNKVTKLEGGRAAFYMLGEDERQYDIIVCGLNMADISGIDLYRYINLNDTKLANNMIFLTDDTDTTSHEKTFLSSINNPCIKKPFTRDQLSKAINIIMGGIKQGLH